MFTFAEYSLNGISNRNQIEDTKNFKLNGNDFECYRSIFLFDDSLKYYVDKTGSVTGYSGKHIADTLVFDFDGKDLNDVKTEVKNFCLYLNHTYDLPLDNIRITFSGSKGFHLSIPFNCITENIKASEDFWKRYKNLALELSEGFQYVDRSIYELKRLLRITNTQNLKSGLYKIRLTFDELENLSISEIKELAKEKRNIDLLSPSEMAVNPHLKAQFEKPITEESKINTDSNNLLGLFDGVTEGNRNNSAIRLTGTLIDQGLSKELTSKIVGLWNLQNSPPIDNRELGYLIEGAYNRYKQKEPETLVYDFKQAADNYREFLQKQSTRKVNLGYELIDKKIRGVMPGETCSILGKTSVGKSAFLQNIGHNYALSSSEPVLFFSLEMPITSVFERALQIETGLAGFTIENQFKEQSNDISEKADLLFSKIPNFYTVVKTGLSLERIKQLILYAESNIYHKKTGLVLIDYLGLVNSSGNDIYQQVSKVARGLKDLAKDTDTPIIYLSQVTKRYSEYDELELGAARDSGAIDEASDFVLALWKQKDMRPKEETSEIVLNLGILKNRKGGLGVTQIELEKQSLKISQHLKYGVS